MVKMKAKNKILVVIFIILVFGIFYLIRKNKPLNQKIVCVGNKCTYYYLGNKYEVKKVNFNKNGEPSFWGKYPFWYYFDGTIWKLLDDPQWNNPQLVEELNIPKEVENL